jgi:hypothetical protein
VDLFTPSLAGIDHQLQDLPQALGAWLDAAQAPAYFALQSKLSSNQIREKHVQSCPRIHIS